MTPEKRVQSSIIKFLQNLKKNGEKMLIQRRQAGGLSYHSGLPDIYILYRGYHIEIEVKASNGKLSELQLRWKEFFESINIPYICCSSLDDFKKFLEKYN